MTSDRYKRLLGAAAVAAGIGFALTPGYASAQTGSDSDSGSSASSDSPSGSKAESKVDSKVDSKGEGPAEKSESAGSGSSAAAAGPTSAVANARPSASESAAAEKAAEESAGEAAPATEDEKPEKPTKSSQRRKDAKARHPSAADTPVQAEATQEPAAAAVVDPPAPEQNAEPADTAATTRNAKVTAEVTAQTNVSAPQPVALTARESTSDVPVAKVATAQITSTVSAPVKNPVAAIVLTVLSWLGWSPRAATAAAFPAVPTPWAVVDWFRDAHPWYNRAPSVTVVTGPPDPTEETAGGRVVGVDPERDDLSYAVSRDARYGTVSIDTVTGQFTYTVVDPTAQADSFAVAVDDGHRAGTAVVVVSVDLSGVPEARKVDVVAGHSTLAIPCGDGCTVPADWYFPTGAEAPNGVIWLQHGFIAGAGWYDKLATQLAVQTNSIVIAPTLSSNPLTSGGKWLNGDVMQHAVADLLADRTALTASAAAAAGHPVELPDRIVLAGHSAGGGLAATVAGYAVDNGAINDILGVVMFDGVPLGDALPTALAKLVGVNDRPVLQIAAHPYTWNNSGQGTDQLVAARPDRFDGVRLANGSHIDSMQASDPLIELAGNLFAGYARAENQLAVQTLAVGWINDMYFGTLDGIYGTAGETLAIGDATADVLGGSVGGSLAVTTLPLEQRQRV